MFEFLLVCSLLVPLSMIVLVKQWEQSHLQTDTDC